MRIKKSSSKPNSLRTLLLFCSVVFFLIVGSLTLKTVNVLRVSRYDGEHRFTMVITGEKTTQVLSLDPNSKKINQVLFPKRIDQRNLVQRYEIPVDAYAKVSEAIAEEKRPGELFKKLLVGIQKKETNATSIDMARLWFLAKSVADSDITTESASDTNVSFPGFFADSTIDNENVTISIVNASGISGLGTRLEHLITNTGATVVSVTTSPTSKRTSSIAYSDDSYTLKKVGQLLGFSNEKKTEQGIADILITIGEDSADPKQF